MKRWFLPEIPDLLAALTEQSVITSTGLGAFVEWSDGDESAETKVRASEHLADEAKRKVQRSLRVAFMTALDPEDIYEISERLDAVMNAAKNVVREADLMAMRPDRHMATMAGQLAAGQSHLCVAIAALGRDDDEATAESDAAVRACRDVERSYRQAMSDLLAVPDIAEVMGRRELYRRYARCADAIEAVGARVWYAVIKSP